MTCTYWDNQCSISKLRLELISSFFLELLWISSPLSKSRFLHSSNGHIRSFPFMLTIEPKMVATFWANNPRIYYKHMSSWYIMFMNPHLTTHHSSIGVQFKYVIKFGRSTLLRWVYIRIQVQETCNLKDSVALNEPHFRT